MEKLTIAVIGGHLVGKSVYTASLMNQILKSKNWNITIDKESQEIYDYHYSCVNFGVIPPATDLYNIINFSVCSKEKQEPEVWDFTLIDFACNATEWLPECPEIHDRSYLEGMVYNHNILKDVNAIIYVVSPLAFKKIQSQCKNINSFDTNNLKDLENFIEALSKVKTKKEIKNIPIAVLIPKYDILIDNNIYISNTEKFLKENDFDITKLLSQFKHFDYFLTTCMHSVNGQNCIWNSNISVLSPILYFISVKPPKTTTRFPFGFKKSNE